MNKIESFQVNHLTLKRGIYVSRKDLIGDQTVTTFDLRMKVPNQEPVINDADNKMDAVFFNTLFTILPPDSNYNSLFAFCPNKPPFQVIHFHL